MLNAEAIKELRDDLAGPKVLQVTGEAERLLTPPGWQDLTPKTPPIKPLEIHTLTGIQHFIETNVDDLKEEDLILHVADERQVMLESNLENGVEPGLRRERYLYANARPASGNFGQFHDSEVFMVWLQSGFVASPAREELIRLLASIRENSVRDTVDDGVAQEVKTAAGVTLVDRTKVPNPIRLRPFRTFLEIEQPESLFVLRLLSGGGERPKCALFEADGGAWKLEAIKSISTWLKEKLPTIAIVA